LAENSKDRPVLFSLANLERDRVEIALDVVAIKDGDIKKPAPTSFRAEL